MYAVSIADNQGAGKQRARVVLGSFLPAERASAFSSMSGCWLDAWFHHHLNAARLMLAASPNALNFLRCHTATARPEIDAGADRKLALFSLLVRLSDRI
jgi:hypothetical protein